MQALFSSIWIKSYLILIFTCVGFSASYSQDVENEKKITEAITHVKSGKYQQAILILEQFADVNGFDDLKFLEINVYLNFSYLATKNEALNVDRVNKLTDSYFSNYDVSKSDGLKREDEMLTLFFVSIINAAIGNNRDMVSYLLFIKNNYEKENLNKEDGLYSEVLKLLTRGYYNIKDYKSTIEIGLIASKLNVDLGQENNSSSLEILDLLYLSYNNINDLDKALEYLKREVEIGKEFLGEKHPDYLNSLGNLASTYYYLGDYNSALLISQQVVELEKEVLGEKHPDYLTSLSNLAISYSVLGDYQSALAINQKVVYLRKEFLGEKHPDYLSSLNNIASNYSELGDYQSAIAIIKRVVDLRKEVLGERNSDYLKSLNNLASSHSKLGDYQSSLAINQQVADLGKEIFGKKHPDYLKSLSKLALSYYYLGDYNSALLISQQVVELEKEVLGEKHSDYLMSLNNLAVSYSTLGDYQLALEINQQVLEAKKEILGEKHPIYLNSMNNLASSYSDLGDYKSALAINQKMTELRKQVLGEKHPDYLRSLNNLACNYSNLGDYESALVIIQQVVELRKEVLGEKNPEYKASLFNLAFSEFHLSKNDAALSHFIQGLNLSQERVIGYFGQLTEYQRENYWKEEIFYFQTMPLFVEKVNQEQTDYVGYAYDISLFTKGLLLNTSIDFDLLIAEKGTPEALTKFEELKLLKLQIQRLNEKPIAERYLNVDSLESVAQRLETELVKLSKEYGDYTQNLKINWKDVQANLGEKDVAIEFLEYPTLTDTVKYAALVLRKGWTNPKFISLFRKDQIEEFIEQEKNQIYSNGFVGKEIKKLVWSQLEEFISPGERVYFSAAGILHQLAIENLAYDESSNLGDRYQMYRLSSTKELAIHQSEPISPSIALYGGLTYDLDMAEMTAESKKYKRPDTFYSMRGIDQDTTTRKGWQFLPGTLAEANEVAQILKENQYQVGEYIAETGNEESFKDLSGRRLGIIHIATHGFFLPIEESRKNQFMQMPLGEGNENVGYVDPMMRSGLMLAGGNRAWLGDSIPNNIEDGILTAKEISHLDLRGTDLVVLSACETGLGDVSSEGVFGLQRAFKQAGAQTIIMSLWNVKDEATQYLMTNFYSYLMQGASKRDAFIQARNKSKSQYRDPDSWAAFIMLD